MKMTISAGMLLLAGMISGCASNAPKAAAANTPVMASAKAPHAECLVCKYNADLACVDLSVDSETPSTNYQGKTYYFCSDTCRKKFEKEPGKYLSQK